MKYFKIDIKFCRVDAKQNKLQQAGRERRVELILTRAEVKGKKIKRDEIDWEKMEVLTLWISEEERKQLYRTTMNEDLGGWKVGL